MHNSPHNFDRHDRVSSLIKEMAASFVQHEANTDPLITVTHVTSSADYRKVTIYITTLPDGKEDAALIFLKRHASELRQFIKKKSNLKIIPHFEFALDAGERHRQRIDEVAREVEKDS